MLHRRFRRASLAAASLLAIALAGRSAAADGAAPITVARPVSFQGLAARPLSQQAMLLLDARWSALGTQADAAFQWWSTVARTYQAGLAQKTGYEFVEGPNVDLDTAVRACDALLALVDGSSASWDAKRWAASQPARMAPATRTQRLRDKVDLDLDGRVSLLELLIDQYGLATSTQDVASLVATMSAQVDSPVVATARAAVGDVERRAQAYEAEKQRITVATTSPDPVKALAAKQQLAAIASSPLAEEVRKAVITAEAAVAAANKQETRFPGTRLWLTRRVERLRATYGKAM